MDWGLIRERDGEIIYAITEQTPTQTKWFARPLFSMHQYDSSYWIKDKILRNNITSNINFIYQPKKDIYHFS